MNVNKNIEHLAQSPLSWLKGKTIAFFGDSITADLRSNYVTLLLDKIADQIDVSSIKIVNDAVDSSTIIDLTIRLPDVILADDPDVAIVFVGVNDSLISRKIDRPLITPRVFEETYAAFIDQLDFIRRRHKILVTLPPLLFEQIITGEFLKDYWYWTEPEYNEYIKVITRIAQRPLCTVANVHELFNRYSGQREHLFYSDGVHPNIYGHRLIAEAVLSALLKLNGFDNTVAR